MRIKRVAVGIAIYLCLFAVGYGFAGDARAADNTEFKVFGYVKMDAMYTDYSDGDLDANSALRDFYIPGAIPVGGSSEHADFDAHAKESRIILETDTSMADSSVLTTFLEMDFLLSPGGDERVSNSYSPRMRHAFIRWNRGAQGTWLFGQYWTNFMIITLPEDLDFVGTPDGTAFGRNPQIHWTSGDGRWEFSAENPETTITPFGGGARIVADDNSIPDLTARYNHKLNNGSVSVAAIFRQLALDLGSQGAAAIDDETYGYGLSVGGKINTVGKDDLRFQATFGSGLGRYHGLNFANGAVIDTGGKLEAIDTVGGLIAYRHCWTPGCEWRSNANYSFIEVDNDTALTGTGANKSAYSASVNVLYSPEPGLTIGAEFAHANRELESGIDGNFDRLQFSVQYGFNWNSL